jgi:hypothetical protein
MDFSQPTPPFLDPPRWDFYISRSGTRREKRKRGGKKGREGKKKRKEKKEGKRKEF